jgi:hypothetical protein
MFKKGEPMMKRTWKSILALSMVLILSLGICVTAFAEDPSSGEEGGEPEIVVPSITKQLEMPVGTNIPTVTFSFEGTPVSVDDNNTDDDKKNMPSLTIDPITFSEKDEGTDADGENAEGTLRVITKTSPLCFDGGNGFTHAGVYVYEVKEVQQSESAEGTASSAGQTYTYSEAVYTVTVVVANHDTYYPAHVDIDEIIVSAGANKYINSVDNEDEIKDNFLFTNTYTKKADGSYTANNDRTGTDALRVIVETEGELADKTKTFPVTISITPTTLETNTKYTVKITHSDGSYEDDYDITKGFELKDGDIVSISGIVVGSTVSVSEGNTDKNYTLTSHNIDGTSTDWTESEGDNYSVYGIIYEGGNTVTLTYTRNTVSLEGITINNIPYVMMICCAAAGIVLVMVTSSRRRREQ